MRVYWSSDIILLSTLFNSARGYRVNRSALNFSIFRVLKKYISQSVRECKGVSKFVLKFVNIPCRMMNVTDKAISLN